MVKAMIFIDGSWLYSNQRNLSKLHGNRIQIDYGKLPQAIADAVALQVGKEIDIVRNCLFGSNAKNYVSADKEMVLKRKDYFEILKEEYHYDTDIHEIDYKRRRLQRKLRDPNDDFEPQEKCVPIALASSALYYANQLKGYDIAIMVIGDRDYIPMLKKVRQLGKRVAIVSIRLSCPQEFEDVRDKGNLKDYDVIWLDDLVENVELRIDTRLVECMSPIHNGDKMVDTDEFIRRGRPYFCSDCREEFKRQQQLHFGDGDYFDETTEGLSTLATGETYYGVVKKMMPHCGFIGTPEGDFYFGIDDAAPDINFTDLQIGQKVSFTVTKVPNRFAKGGAGNGNAGVINIAV